MNKKKQFLSGFTVLIVLLGTFGGLSSALEPLQRFYKPQRLQSVPNPHERVIKKAQRVWITEDLPLETQKTPVQMQNMRYVPQENVSVRFFQSFCAQKAFSNCISSVLPRILPKESVVRSIQYGYDYKIPTKPRVQTQKAQFRYTNNEESGIVTLLAAPDGSVYIFSAQTGEISAVKAASAVFRAEQSAFFVF